MNDLTNYFEEEEKKEGGGTKEGILAVSASRATQEVQGAIVSAKKFPRDQFESYRKIMKSCERPSLSQQAMYAYPRGGSMVTGPSIRLAEVMAQCWGNLDFGIRELSQKEGESIVESFCWDLESNVRQTKTFTVKHERHLKGGRVVKLKDTRDIYELVANQGARRLRACILGIIPGDITEAAVQKCDDTVKNGDSEPFETRLKKMITAFDKLGVSSKLIEERVGHKIEAIVPAEFVDLIKIYTSIKDGVSDRKQWFNFGKEVDENTVSLNEKFSKQPPA